MAESSRNGNYEALAELFFTGTGLVFRNADGGPLYHTWLDQQHAEVRRLLGFSEEFVLHSLRHTFGTRLGASGADVRTIMDLMGHSC